MRPCIPHLPVCAHDLRHHHPAPPWPQRQPFGTHLLRNTCAADVLTIENSRSDDEMVRALAAYGYGRDVGPGVYDVHSPVVPPVDFLERKIRVIVQVDSRWQQGL